MSTFMILVLVASVLYNLSFTFCMHTKNNISALIFKVIPFFFAVVIGIFLLGQFGIVAVNI